MSQPPHQPYPGQPNPDVPSSVPPQPGYPPQPPYPQPEYAPPGYPQTGYQPTGYQQPGSPQGGYAQPGYAQPGYPQQGPPMPGYPPAPRKSRALPITLVSIALVLVLCGGGGTAIYLAGRNTAEGIADVIASAAPTQPTRPTQPAEPTETATTAPPARITIVEPRTLGGRPKVKDKKFAASAEQLERSLALVPGATQTVGALYGTPSKRDLVVVVAARSYVGNPKRELDNAFTGPGMDELKLVGISSIPAGPLGGVAKCAKGNAGGAPVSMCAWADEGSSGWVFWYFTSLSKAKAEFVKLRGQVEKKSN
ncbi:hypothetical protein GCM10020358_42590 [Amorphoplanes nipponensis]|uniref:Flagellar basal body-associated protein FliL n=1 Tax=Actinoplanes nipponensis TaxID=135950 RepID=A0A919JE72_9ACTN|nr:hypothetical protein [Actinoplanes nipponensis]GIE47551.1 hypothetical protein Ani05nite_10850 [Actinoplanes nipponensis]